MAAVPFNYVDNIFIQNNPVAYRREVARYLDLIRTTGSGRTLIKFIKMSARRLLIKPYHPTREYPVNAVTELEDPLAAYPKGDPEMHAVRAGYMWLLPGGADPKAILMLPTGDLGTGGGSPVTIYYHPAAYRELIKRKGRMDPSDGPGEALFHEMVHAMRAMRAKYSDTTVLEDLRMDDFEEFCAILAQNIYRQERGFTLLRRDHWSHARLEGDLLDSGAYYEKYRASIDKWFASQSVFCLELARSNVKFNPLREAAVARGMMQPPPPSMRLP
jgi:hypothetical protein